VAGLREDVVNGSDTGTNGGSADQWLFQPKGDIIATPLSWLEFYASAGLGFHSNDLRGVTQATSSGNTGAPLMAKQTGEELGLRAIAMPSFTTTLTYFYMKSQSETTYDPDAGQDSAGPGSRRTAFEINTTWQALNWLEFYIGLAVSHARYTEVTDDGVGGHLGYYIPNAPSVIGSLAAYASNLDPWSGGLEYRYLGPFSVTPDNAVRAKAMANRISRSAMPRGRTGNSAPVSTMRSTPMPTLPNSTIMTDCEASQQAASAICISIRWSRVPFVLA
jgi:hypothetical protein